MRVCVIGDSGLLGQALVQELLQERSSAVMGVSSSEFSGTRYWRPFQARYEHQAIDLLRNRDTFLKHVLKFNPELIVNCAALTDIAECERHKELAEKLNVQLAGWLAQLSAREGIDFIHFSSDQVFDGRRKTHYGEEDPPCPINWYGKTKWLGEREVQKNYGGALIVRTNIVGFKDYGERPVFAEWLCQSLVDLDEITLFDDYITSSIHVRALSHLVLCAYAKKISGVLNLVTRDCASKYELGERFARLARLDFSAVKKGALVTSGLTPPRPSYLALNTARGEKALNVMFPSVEDTTKELLEDFKLRFEGISHAPR